MSVGTEIRMPARRRTFDRRVVMLGERILHEAGRQGRLAHSTSCEGEGGASMCV